MKLIKGGKSSTPPKNPCSYHGLGQWLPVRLEVQDMVTLEVGWIETLAFLPDLPVPDIFMEKRFKFLMKCECNPKGCPDGPVVPFPTQPPGA